MARRNTDKKRARREAAKSVPKLLIADAGSGGDVVLTAAAGEAGQSGPPTFKAVVYTGGKMRPQGFAYPVVAELRGLKVMAGPRPALYVHDQKRPVGHCEVSIDRSVRAEGALSVPGDDADMIASAAGNQFPWKTSMGVLMEELKFYDSDQTFTANGRSWRGPCYHLVRGQLYEVSFVTVAGDNTSSATIAASLGGLSEKETVMGFEQWLTAKFGDMEFDEDQLTLLKAAFQAEQEPPADPPAKDLKAAGGAGDVDVASLVRKELQAAGGDYLSQLRQQSAAELQRQGEIHALCARFDSPTINVDQQGNPVADGGRQVNLEAHAVAMNWSRDQVELQCLRASRGSGPAIHSRSSDDLNANVLECAARMTIGGANTEDRLLKEYGEQTLSAAGELRNVGLRDCARIACQIENVHTPPTWGDGRATLRAAFTTQTLPYVFENVLNKTLLAIYEGLPSVAKQICKISRCTDFKQVSRVRLLGSGAWTQVGADGELKHGTVSDEKLTNQADTYGQYLMITRQDWINDDLGALEDLSRYMAMMGNQIVEDTFFALLLSNPNNFFHANNANLGSTGAFGDTSLKALRTLFRKQKKGPGSKEKNKRPLNIPPSILLVPVELEHEADVLIGSANMMVGDRASDVNTTTTKLGTNNPHRGKYQVLSAPQLSDDYFTGYSTTAFYLFADPNMLAAFDLMFLNGVQQPTVEAVEPRPDTLGMGYRGYIDFGCKEQDPLGAAKEPGT